MNSTCESYDQESLIQFWKGMQMFEDDSLERFDITVITVFTMFNCTHPSYATIPIALYLGGVGLYNFKLLPTLPKLSKSVIFTWNLSIGLFSIVGAAICIPKLIELIVNQHLYGAICAPATKYGTGYSGIMITLFIYSKFVEFGDTYILIANGKKVIPLHWWHHASVTWFCWNAFAYQISTGIWFAAINYFVHSIMYTYYALTLTPIKPYIYRYRHKVTQLQILQMVVGLFVIFKSMQYRSIGYECYTHEYLDWAGIAMYFSYLVLFVQFYLKKTVQIKSK